MRISISSAALFRVIFLFLPPLSVFAQHVGSSTQKYHADHNQGDNDSEYAWQNMTTENMEGNNSCTSTEDMSRSYSAGDEQMEHMKRAHPLQVAAGSRLPDCSHACGSCTPCRLMMVNLICASLAEAETCPISYRCICNSKSYPVP